MISSQSYTHQQLQKNLLQLVLRVSDSLDLLPQLFNFVAGEGLRVGRRAAELLLVYGVLGLLLVVDAVFSTFPIRELQPVGGDVGVGFRVKTVRWLA